MALKTLYVQGVSPTTLVYQSKEVVLQVVLPWALTALRDQLKAHRMDTNKRAIRAPESEEMEKNEGGRDLEGNRN
jgi:hypothetical protein